MVNNPLVRPYFLGGGGIGGVPLDSHDVLEVSSFWIFHFNVLNPWFFEKSLLFQLASG